LAQPRTKKESNKIINRIASRQTELKYTTAYRSIQYGPNEIEHFNSTYRDSTWKPSIRTMKNLSTHSLTHQQTPALPTLRHEPTTNPTPTHHSTSRSPPLLTGSQGTRPGPATGPGTHQPNPQNVYQRPNHTLQGCHKSDDRGQSNQLHL